MAVVCEDIYNELEKDIPIVESPEYASLVNFLSSSKHPIHRWYYYREGFAPELVHRFINQAYRPGSLVIDPFVGGGTTCLVAAQRNIDSVGLETNPFSAFIARVKTRKYTKSDLKALRALSKQVLDCSFEPTIAPPKLSIVDKLFEDESKNVLQELLMYKEFINSVKPPKYRDFLFFGWLAILERVSNSRKGGNGLKRKYRPNKDPHRELFYQYETMLGDLEYLLQKGGGVVKEPSIIADSALRLHDYIEQDSTSLAIFSPPYANCFDYCEIYKVELWMGDFVNDYSDLRALRAESIYSHLNMARKAKGRQRTVATFDEILLPEIENGPLWDKRIPDMLSGYFQDMASVLASLHSRLVKGGLCVIVVGNSAYAGVVVPTDLLLCKIAEQTGYSVESVHVARLLVTSSQQYKALGQLNKYVRESVILLRR